VKPYNQISVGLLEMSSMLQSTKSMKSMRKTRRSSRQVVLDELELVMRRLEQIKNMVDKHCVAPSKEKEPSVRSQIVAHMQSKAEAKPLTPVQEEEAAPEEAAVEEAAPEEAAVEEAAPEEPSKLALAVEPAAPKRRKSGGCPGGPKAYNEFVKKWLADQRASGRQMTYQEAR